MEVILTQDVKGQGKKGQLVKVSDGYARNFLFPRKLATPATKDALNAMKGQQDAAAQGEAVGKGRQGLADLQFRQGHSLG